MLGDVSHVGSMSVVLSVLTVVDVDVLLLRCAVDSLFLGIVPEAKVDGPNHLRYHVESRTNSRELGCR